MKILIVMPVIEKHKKMLFKAFPEGNFIYNENPTSDDVKDAEIIIGNVDTKLLSKARKLKWLHLNTAGTDGYCIDSYSNEIILTNSTGAYGLALSEYLLATILCMFKKLYKYHVNQQKHLWIDEGPVDSIQGSTFLIVGLGDIGQELAKKLHLLGAKVWGIKRRITSEYPYIEKLATLEKLQTLSSKADVVINILPNTDKTIHLFDEKFFKTMKKNAYFINGGRGNAVVEDDLIRVLKQGHLAGVAIDVTEKEPLGKNSPLWNTPRLYITPHTAGQYHLWQTHDKIIEIASMNLKKYIQDLPLENIVDFTTGYRK